MAAPLDPTAVIAALDLRPHPEGGWFAETWRDDAGTVIYFLLEADQTSWWHRVHGGVETWHHYAGAPLDLLVADPAGVDGRGADGLGAVTTTRLGTDLAAGERPQAIVPAGAWQAARPVGGAVLVGCTVAPPFSFDAFELAPRSGFSLPTP